MQALGVISHADTNRKRRIGLLFTVFAIVAAINAPPRASLFDYVPFWRPFQIISDNNRWISAGLALALIVACLLRRSLSSSIRWSCVGILLFPLHLLIFVKNLSSIGASAIPFLIGFLLLVIATWLVARTMAGGRAANQGAWSPLVLASVGFLFANFIQYEVNPAATMQVSNRFHGLTSNPQMYALTVAIMVPALLYQYTKDRRKILRLFILIAFFLLLFFALKSGSRLSVLLSAVSVLMYYRTKVRKFANFAIPALLLLMLYMMYNEQLPIAGDSHITSLENTRSQVWEIQVQAIVKHPLFGQPLGFGERAGFGENSYLAAGSTLGVSGLLLALGVGFLIGQTILSLIRLERRVGWRPDLALPIAVLSSCLLGSFFEAFLLGIFTFPLAAFLYTEFVSEEMLQFGTKVMPQFARRRRLTIGRYTLPSRYVSAASRNLIRHNSGKKSWSLRCKQWRDKIKLRSAPLSSGNNRSTPSGYV